MHTSLLKWPLWLVVLVLTDATVWGQSAVEVVVDRNVAMKTRDGVTLRADVYRPETQKNLPVLLQRTPYNKANSDDLARKAARRGYLVVIQDVRGRYASDGDWYPFKNEGNDGFDTVEWAAGLPDANGKVGMFGGSYVGATQMLAAVNHPPHLAGICPVVTASNYHENWTYQGGAFEQWFNESWTSGLAQDTLDRLVRKRTNAMVGSSVLPLKQYPLFNLEPLSNAEQITAELAPYFLDWIDHPAYDAYWKRWSIEDQYASIQVPALTIAAWYDIFQIGSLRNYEGMKEHAATAAARREQRLLIEIGGHAGGGRKIGSVDFGEAATEHDENEVMLDWYDYLLQGKPNEFANEKHVQYFLMGENRWLDADTWPPEQAKATAFYLHSNGRANSLSGDGGLSAAAPDEEPIDSYTYDPNHPVPTVGGPLCCDAEHLAPGPKDQREVEARPDVLVYSTAPLDHDIQVTGPVRLNLYAKTSAVDTDFTAKLVDVWPNGFAQNLTDGIIRAKYRESTEEAKPILPDTIYLYQIDLGSTGNLFLKGHRIRLEVSSSNFPRFDRNLNTKEGSNPGSSSFPAMTPATNGILHDSKHRSSLMLSLMSKY